MSSELHVARALLAQSDAWLMFCEVPLTTGAFFRLVRARRHVQADAKVWQAAAMKIELPSEDAEGSLGEVAIAIPNVSRLPMAYVEVSGELLGQTVTLQLAHESNGFAFEPGLRWTHVITRARANEKVIHFTAGHEASTMRVPSRVFDRTNFPQLLPAG
jgi:hypothetical protein